METKQLPLEPPPFPDITALSALLKWYEQEQQASLRHLQDLLKHPGAKAVAAAHQAHQSEPPPTLGFNVFSIVTDTYKKENLHSHILHAFLDPKSSHGEGTAFLQLFIAYLQRFSKTTINAADYRHAEVYRERYRIDVSITDRQSGRAIIIENKINRAGDQQRQIPRYVEMLEKEEGYTVDAVVYLNLTDTKAPAHHDWTKEEIEYIGPKTIVVSAFRAQPNDLVQGWIEPCIKAASNIDALVLFRQYRLLLQKIAHSDMNKQLMEQFYTLMLGDKQFANALSLRDMLNNLTNYRVERIIDIFNGRTEPFNKGINRWNNIAYMEDSITHLVIDIGVHEQKYIVEFFNRKYVNGESSDNTALPILQALGMEDQFKVYNKRFKIRFRFPEEEQQLYTFIQDFQKKLVQVLSKGNTATAIHQ